MILFCFGTRPEWIKIRPVIDAIEGLIPYRILYTQQHTDLIDDSLKNYEYYTLHMANMSKNRLDDIVVSILLDINAYGILKDITHVFVQGDTTTAFACALAAFHRQIPIIHLEAGLRSRDKNNPYPEEFNRFSITGMADIHLCPTEKDRMNVIQSIGKFYGNTYVIGNTVLDTIRDVNTSEEDLVLITMHRRENHAIVEDWFKAISHLASLSKSRFVFPIHPNPNVLKHKDLLKGVEVIDPLGRNDLINLLSRCKYVITDSGGIQEEAAFLRKKCIVCRKVTEREAGVGTFSFLCKNPNNLINMAHDIENYQIPANQECPYGDGHASEKIRKILLDVYYS